MHKDTENRKRYVRQEPMCEYVGGLSESKAEKMRLDGSGPPFIKVGNVVLYDLNDVDAWLEQRKRRSTSDAVA